MSKRRKRLGQHFLHDQHVISKIIDAISPHCGQKIVEIGPGRGALTVPLIERGVDLTAIEVDQRLAEQLQRRASLKNVKVMLADALKVDYSGLFGEGSTSIRIVGNLPYSISSPLIFKFLEAMPKIQDCHLMLQREVVERMAARPGQKAYGRLTVMLSTYCNVVPLFDVPPEAFSPAPQVVSSVVKLIPHTTSAFETGAPEIFAHLVRSAFSARRKTIRNALQRYMPASLIASANIDPSARPQTLSPEDYGRLSSIASEARLNIIDPTKKQRQPRNASI